MSFRKNNNKKTAVQYANPWARAVNNIYTKNNNNNNKNHVRSISLTTLLEDQENKENSCSTTPLTFRDKVLMVLVFAPLLL